VLALDHVSVHLPALSPAADALEQLTGLAPAVTPGHPWHSRLHLHRSYLELREAPGAVTGSVALYFLGYAAPAPEVRGWLGSRGLWCSEPSVYVGVDGTWEELHVKPAAASRERPVTLVRRLTPREVAADWPPGLPDRRVRLHAVLLTAHPGTAAWMRALGAASPDRSFPLGGRVWQRCDVALPDGGALGLLSLAEDEEGDGRACGVELGFRPAVIGGPRPGTATVLPQEPSGLGFHLGLVAADDLGS
jgi:hypothetical protein